MSAISDRVSARSPSTPSLGSARAAPDPVGAPEDVNRRLLLSILEAFFRRPLVHLIPLALLMVFGAYSGFSAAKQYRSVGTLTSSSGTILGDIGQSSTNGGFGYESAADSTARNLNQLLGTEAFVDNVIERAGLTTAVARGLLSNDDVRHSVSATADGDNLFSVAATTENPEQSQRLARGTIDEFLAYVVENDNADRLIAIDTYTTQRDARTTELDTANKAYTDYMLAHQIADEDSRPFVERLEIQRLEGDVEQSTTQFQDADSRLSDAQLQASVAQTVIERQLRLVDAPETPDAPEARLKKAALTVVLFTVLGAVLSLVFLLLSAFLDRTIRESNDISERFGMDVVAVIPTARRR